MSKKKRGGKKELGFGIIGCGMISEFHANAVIHGQGMRLVACQSRNPENVQRRVKQFGIEGFTDLKKFLAHPELDVVTICTPSGAHLEPTLAAARAGKHVICEKPLEVTLERCDRMIAACGKAGVLLGGIFPSRTNEVCGEIKREVDSGRFGRLIFGHAVIHWWRSQAYYESGAWRGTWRLDGGGALMNQSIHTIDLLQWFLGPVTEVVAHCAARAHEGLEVEDAALALLKFANGAMGTVQGTTAGFPGHPAAIQILGEFGSIFYADGAVSVWQFGREDRRKKTVREVVSTRDRKILARYGAKATEGRGRGAADPRAISFVGHQKQFEDFVQAIQAGRRPLVDGLEGRKAIEIILAIYAAALRGSKPVKLPLKRTPARWPFAGQ